MPQLSLSLRLLGLTTQLPFMQTPFPESTQVATSMPEFSFKEGLEVFAPKDLVGLARPGSGVANENGDLVLVPVSRYSFEEKK
jgi:hypothetical protein